MYTSPYPHIQFAFERHREMLASAQQQLARQQAAQARAPRPVSRAAQRLRRSLRIATARHTA